MARRKAGVPVRLTDTMITCCHLGAALYIMHNPDEVAEIADIRDALALLPDYVGRTDRIQRRRKQVVRSLRTNTTPSNATPKSAMYRFRPSDVSKVIKLLRIAADIPTSSMAQIAIALDNRADDLAKLDTVTLLGYAAL